MYSAVDKKTSSLSTPKQTPSLEASANRSHRPPDPPCVDTAPGAFEADTQILQRQPDSHPRAESGQTSCCWEAGSLLLRKRRGFLGPEPYFTRTGHVKLVLPGAVSERGGAAGRGRLMGTLYAGVGEPATPHRPQRVEKHTSLCKHTNRAALGAASHFLALIGRFSHLRNSRRRRHRVV